MLYRFKSPATADLTMLEAPAIRLLQVIGKTPGPQGVISPDEVPAAVQALRQAIEVEKARTVAQPNQTGHADEPESRSLSDQAVSLHQRAAPFIQVLEEAAAAGERVTWGV